MKNSYVYNIFIKSTTITQFDFCTNYNTQHYGK